jgi:hypothetical protein
MAPPSGTSTRSATREALLVLKRVACPGSGQTARSDPICGVLRPPGSNLPVSPTAPRPNRLFLPPDSSSCGPWRAPPPSRPTQHPSSSTGSAATTSLTCRRRRSQVSPPSAARKPHRSLLSAPSLRKLAHGNGLVVLPAPCLTWRSSCEVPESVQAEPARGVAGWQQAPSFSQAAWRRRLAPNLPAICRTTAWPCPLALIRMLACT